MVVLGLGSNMGDRLGFLRQALALLKQISTLEIKQASPVYQSDALLPENAAVIWDTPYLNLALRCETTLRPDDLLVLTKQIEKKIGRQQGADWSPRPIDIDILVWDDLIQYDDKLHIPHEHLHTRPFALWPLADVAPHWIYPLQNEFQGKTAIEIADRWGSRFSGNAPLHTQQLLQRIDTPALVGIINVSPDSFSERKNRSIIEIAQQAQHLVASGAEIIDIGAEATGPDASAISADQEWQRLALPLQTLLSLKNTCVIPPKISVDTRNPTTAKKVLDLGVDWINDQSGLENPAMCDIVQQGHQDIVFMHQLGIPVQSSVILPKDNKTADHIFRWATQQVERLAKLGIHKDRLIFDMGIGFGKSAEQSLTVIQQIHFFNALQMRLLVGHSRKSFLKLFTPLPASERDIETLPVSLFLAKQNVDFLRIHNVEMCARALRVAQAIDV